ncbi:S49 family peptidase [Paracoccus sp. SY]|uniref:S49 family peptidase n=1 Tax=Paracoccus sp. SY TaxID=1330255 RepID=UPI000CD077F5|nr:S49 family peptidase [Paracoccus sp. SY]
MTHLLHLADRALNRPLLIHPDKAAIILEVLAGRIGIDASPLVPAASRFAARSRAGERQLVPVSGGVAVISIIGTLVNRGAWVGASSGLVSYEGISAQLHEAATDPAVHSVILDLDTGGGEAGGITGVAKQIAALAKQKRVVAVVNDTACSGGYWIASAANEIVVSETSMVGSIGVVVLHVNRAGEMKQKGWEPTFIYAGAHKVDGHSLAPLSDSVRADVQASIDALYRSFCQGVAVGRGSRLTEAAARATEARVYLGADTIAAGLADRVDSFDAVLRSLQRAVSAPRGHRRTQAGPATQRPPKGAAAVAPPGWCATGVKLLPLIGKQASAKKEDVAAILTRSIERINQQRNRS